MLDERRAGLRPDPLDDVEDAAGKPHRLASVSEQLSRERCLLGRLEHGAVAAQDRGEDLPGDVRQRRVEGDDQSGHAHGLPHGHHGSVGHARRRRAPVVAATLACDEEPHLHGRSGLPRCERLRLAGLLDHGGRELVAPLTKGERDLADEVATLDDRVRRPGLLRGPRGRTAASTSAAPGPRSAAESRAVGGPQLLEPLARIGGRAAPSMRFGTVWRANSATVPLSTQ